MGVRGSGICLIFTVYRNPTCGYSNGIKRLWKMMLIFTEIKTGFATALLFK